MIEYIHHDKRSKNHEKNDAYMVRIGYCISLQHQLGVQNSQNNDSSRLLLEVQVPHKVRKLTLESFQVPRKPIVVFCVIIYKR